MRDDSAFYLLASTMGQSILVETLSAAAYYIHNSNRSTIHWHTRKAKQEGASCFLFIQGTGLEQLIESYYLDYDADKIREGFRYCVKRHFRS